MAEATSRRPCCTPPICSEPFGGGLATYHYKGEFRKLRLNPGEKQHVVLKLDKRSFSYYDVDGRDWRVDPGKFVIYVGDSSESTPLKQDLQM